MLGAPSRLAHLRVADLLVVAALDRDRDRQPLESARRLDEVAVAPVSPRVLHVVEQDEFVYRVDEVEVPLPRDVARLHDGDSLHGQAAGADGEPRSTCTSAR